METGKCSEMDTAELMPDLSIVKTEYFEAEDNEPHLQYKPPYPREIIESGLIEIHTADSTTDRSEHQSCDPDLLQPETASAAAVTSTDQYFGNKIILGVKRTKDHQLREDSSAVRNYEERCFHTKLVIRNWGDYLDKSNTFCHDCLILFPTVNSLDYHKMTCHSHLVAINEVENLQLTDNPVSAHPDRQEPPHADEPHPKRLKTNNCNQVTLSVSYQCSLCPSVIKYKPNMIRHYKNVHKVSAISNMMLHAKNEEVCAVCKALLPSQDALIEHMYQKHYDKQFHCSICSLNFGDKKDLEDHLYEHAKNKFAENKKILLKCKPTTSNNIIQLGIKPRASGVLGVTKNSENKNNKLSASIHCHYCKTTCGSQASLRQHIQLYCKKTNKKETLKICEEKVDSVSDKVINLGRSVKLPIRKAVPTALNVKSKLGMSGAHPCLCCTKRFPKRAALMKHVDLLHKHRLKYTCQLCHKDFRRFNICKIHLIQVHGNKNCANIVLNLRNLSTPGDSDDIESNVVAVDHIFQCKSCDVYYTNYKQTRYHKNHHNLNIVQCKICDLKFSEDWQSIDYHYYQHKINPGKPLNVISIDNANHSLRSILLLKCPLCDIYFTIVGLSNHVRHHSSLSRNTKIYFCKICNIKVYQGTKKNHIKCHNNNKEFTFVKYEIVTPEKIEEIRSGVIPPKVVELTSDEPRADTAALLERYNKITATWNILFVCIACHLASDNYTHVVEHCHAHMLGRTADLITRKCHRCDLTFDENAFDRHYSIHMSNSTIDRHSFSISQYEHSWITTSNWIANISRHIPSDNFQDFVNNSIYKKTRNVILEVTRDGDPDLTVFVCHRCGFVVHEKNVSTHIAKLCYGMYKRTNAVCRSTCCGLKFPRTLLRNNHDMMHKERPSFRCRIVTFNKPSDWKSNKILMGKDKLIVGRKRQILYKCRDCELCMSEDAMKSHLRSEYECTFRVNEYRSCSQCDLKFTKDEILSHLNKHKTSEFIRENVKVIVIDRGLTNLEATPSLSDNNDTDSARALQKRNKMYTIYQCLACHKCVMGLKGRHSCESKDARICSICKTLTFGRKSMAKHIFLHRHNPDYNIHNFNMVYINRSTEQLEQHTKTNEINDDDVDTNKNTIVKVKKKTAQFLVYKCKTCSICFARLPNAKRHGCYDSIRGAVCDKCGLTVHVNKLSVHLLKHKSRPEFTKDNIKIVEFDKSIPFDHYKKIAKTHFESQGIFTHYQCSVCSILYRIKFNCLKHIKQCTGDAQAHVRCHVCKYKVSNNAAYRHSNMHKLYPNITINVIKVGANSVKVPKAKSKVVSKPKSKVVSQPKSKMISKLPSDAYTLYQCSACGMCTHTERSSKLHTSKQCGDRRLISKCRKCNLRFLKTTIRNSHRKFHGSKKYVHINLYKMIRFDPSGSDATSDSLTGRDPRSANEIASNDGNVTVYQCVDCKLCFYTEASVKIHKHDGEIKSKNDGVKCCGLSFSRSQYRYRHVQHHKDANFTRESIVLESFAPEPKNSLYRCATCGVHYPTLSGTTLHGQRCTARTQPKCVQCDRCHLSFLAKSLRKHKAIHNNCSEKIDYKIILFNETKTDENSVKEVVAESGRTGRTVHTCPECSETFDSKAALNIHTQLDHTDGEVECLFCGASFHMSILNTVHLRETEQGVRCCVCEERVRRGDAELHAATHAATYTL